MLRTLTRVLRSVRVAAFTLIVLATAAGCSAGVASDSPEPLTVFAAVSLTEAFSEMASAFESAHSEVSVDLNFAGSQRLRVQLEHGARADVFASADTRQMDLAQASGLISGEVVNFASNRLVIIAPKAPAPPRGVPSPNRLDSGAPVRTVNDMARDGVKVALAQREVPAGGYARAVIEKMAEDPRFGPDYARRVLANVVSEEPNVRSVLQKVILGEADAGIVYSSDAQIA